MKKKLSILLLCTAMLFTFAASADEEADADRYIRLPVVMYHHISKRSGTWNAYVISPEEFAGDMDYLAENGWQSISVKELLAWYDGEFEMPEKPFMITFDDGFESTLAYAEPVLAEYGFKGVAAVIGSVCEKFTNCNEHDPELSNMSWEDASAMADRGVIEIQCHTWNMHGLAARRGCSRMAGESLEAYRAALSTDLSRFLQGCEQRGVDIVPSIAYPYGAFDKTTSDVVRDMGFQAAFTCDEYVNKLYGKNEELFRIARFNRPHGISSEKFFSVWEENA